MNPVESLSPESQRVLAVWHALAPPIRPSSEDIEAMECCWIGGKGARVLVQGATPELVDLAIRKQASRIIAMDWRAAIFPALRCLGIEDWADVENILCDWRTFMPELEGALDMVLGDASLTMLAFPEEWEQALQALQRYLVPGGRAILRLAFQLKEDFDFGSYLRKRLDYFDLECAKATSIQREGLMRSLLGEIRLATGLGSAGQGGGMDLGRRADLTRLFRAELTTRYSQWPEWEAIQVGLPQEEDVRKGVKTAKGFPRWEAALRLIEACGFRVRHVELSGTRPAPGVMRVVAAERV